MKQKNQMKHKNKIVTPDSPDDVKLPRKCSQMYENTRHDLMATRCALVGFKSIYLFLKHKNRGLKHKKDS